MEEKENTSNNSNGSDDEDNDEVTSAKTFLRLIPEAVRKKVVDTGAILQAIAEQEEDLPPHLHLGTTEIDDKAITAEKGNDINNDNGIKQEATPSSKIQFRDLLTWDADPNIPDPGQTVSLRKYDPIDMLLIKERAKTRDEAVDALRLCDQMCLLLGNQSHCVSFYTL